MTCMVRLKDIEFCGFVDSNEVNTSYVFSREEYKVLPVSNTLYFLFNNESSTVDNLWRKLRTLDKVNIM